MELKVVKFNKISYIKNKNQLQFTLLQATTMNRSSIITKISLLAICFIESLSGTVVYSKEIYSYIDSEGILNFTDRPSPNSSRRQVTTAQESRPTVRIYKFIDTNGVVHLTDQPDGPGYHLIFQGDGAFLSFSGQPYGLAKIHNKYKDYYNLVEDVANNTQLEPEFLHAVIQTESAYNPNAVSPKGAVGLMQLMPATARRYGVSDRSDVFSNLYGGARYLRYLLNLFGGNKELALAGYNAGENAVIRYGNQIPPYRETKSYVKRAMAIYQTHLGAK